jgi:hypothetical protein
MDDETKTEKIKSGDKLYKYEEAPQLLKLKKSEKFIDDGGNVCEVEVRGDRTEDGTWFRAEDLGKAFGIKKIYEVITKSTSSYEKNQDYKIFNVPKTNRIVLFLSMRGLIRLIFTSRKGLTKETIDVFLYWIRSLCSITEKKLILKINEDREKWNNRYGYVYCVTSEIINGIKIGYWYGNIQSLESRYRMYYGKNINIFYYRSKQVEDIEKIVLDKFSEKRIYGELFCKNSFDDYKKYIETMCTINLTK